MFTECVYTECQLREPKSASDEIQWIHVHACTSIHDTGYLPTNRLKIHAHVHIIHIYNCSSLCMPDLLLHSLHNFTAVREHPKTKNELVLQLECYFPSIKNVQDPERNVKYNVMYKDVMNFHIATNAYGIKAIFRHTCNSCTMVF